ncbi:DUF6053 domain-containing protein [Lysobacter enzymogenes]
MSAAVVGGPSGPTLWVQVAASLRKEKHQG